MYYSFEGKIEKDICVIMEDYPDGSFSIKFSFTTLDIIGIVNDLLTGQYL